MPNMDEKVPHAQPGANVRNKNLKRSPLATPEEMAVNEAKRCPAVQEPPMPQRLPR